MATDDVELEALVKNLQIASTHTGSSTSKENISTANLWRYSIYVKVYTDKRIRFSAFFQSTILSIWSQYGVKQINYIHNNLFMIVFHSINAADSVIEDGPWSYQNDFMLIENMKQGQPVEAYMFDKLTMWVQIHNLPQDYLCPEVITNMLRGFGNLMPLDPLFVAQWRSFARVKLEFSLPFKLKQFAESRMDSGELICGQLRYERLQRFCVVCCEIGHDAMTCTSRLRVMKALHSVLPESLRGHLIASITPKLTDSIKCTHQMASGRFQQNFTSPKNKGKTALYNNMANTGNEPVVSQMVRPINQLIDEYLPNPLSDITNVANNLLRTGGLNVDTRINDSMDWIANDAGADIFTSVEADLTATYDVQQANHKQPKLKVAARLHGGSIHSTERDLAKVLSSSQLNKAEQFNGANNRFESAVSPTVSHTKSGPITSFLLQCNSNIIPAVSQCIHPDDILEESVPGLAVKCCRPDVPYTDDTTKNNTSTQATLAKSSVLRFESAEVTDFHDDAGRFSQGNTSLSFANQMRANNSNLTVVSREVKLPSKTEAIVTDAAHCQPLIQTSGGGLFTRKHEVGTATKTSHSKSKAFKTRANSRCISDVSRNVCALPSHAFHNTMYSNALTAASLPFSAVSSGEESLVNMNPCQKRDGKRHLSLFEDQGRPTKKTCYQNTTTQEPVAAITKTDFVLTKGGSTQVQFKANQAVMVDSRGITTDAIRVATGVDRLPLEQ